MNKAAALTLVVAGLLCSVATPVWALAQCPLLNHQPEHHSCCPHPAPVSHPDCRIQCSFDRGDAVLMKSVVIVPAVFATAAVPVAAVSATVIERSVFPPATFDSSGLYLRVRILRI